MNQNPALVIRPVRLADAAGLVHVTALRGSAASADPEGLRSPALLGSPAGLDDSANNDDAAQIAAIYAYHVHHGTATFDTEAPTLDAWRAKTAQSLDKGWPFLVAVEGTEILGYAYAAQFRDRPAYRHSCEDSIYIRADRTGQGLGTALLSALIAAADQSDFTQMLAVISEGEPASVALHARLGFHHAGRMEKVGLKFGKWLDTIYMQRALADMPTSWGGSDDGVSEDTPKSAGPITDGADGFTTIRGQRQQALMTEPATYFGTPAAPPQAIKPTQPQT